MIKLEIGGGGNFALGNGWVNLDIDERADIRHDLDKLPWPVADDSVIEVYSSHCLEHVQNPFHFMFEVARVCVIGAPVTIKVPFPTSDLAMTFGHRHVFSPLKVKNFDHYFPHLTFHPDQKKRLKWVGTKLNPTEYLEDAKRELPFLAGLSDEVIMRWIPRTCHESVFTFTVTANEFYKPDQPAAAHQMFDAIMEKPPGPSEGIIQP